MAQLVMECQSKSDRQKALAKKVRQQGLLGLLGLFTTLLCRSCSSYREDILTKMQLKLDENYWSKKSHVTVEDLQFQESHSVFCRPAVLDEEN